MTTIQDVMKVLQSHGTEEMLYATSVAFHAARFFQEKYPEEFRKAFGTIGEKIIIDAVPIKED